MSFWGWGLRLGGRRGGGASGPPWLIPTADDQLVSCYEPTEPVYRAGADALGIEEAVQDIAWPESLLGGSRWFAPQSLATSVVSGVARCELGMDPAASINLDSSLAACQAMGPGWTLMTQAQWHVLMVISHAYWASQSKANPTGNTQHGHSDQVAAEVGIRADGLAVTGLSQGSFGRTLTSLRAIADGGGQLLAWSHDGSPTGVFDLVGNVWEWSSRMRVNEGLIEIIPASAGVQPDQGVSSTAWRAIRPDGTLVATDAGGDMLHYDATGGISLALARDGTGSVKNNWFRSLTAGAITPVPPVLVAHMLYPWSASVPTVGRFYVNTAGERLPLRGGPWSNGSSGGGAALSLSFDRGGAFASVGFRPAFVI